MIPLTAPEFKPSSMVQLELFRLERKYQSAELATQQPPAPAPDVSAHTDGQTRLDPITITFDQMIATSIAFLEKNGYIVTAR